MPDPVCNIQPAASSDSEVLVRAENVSKKFCRNLKKSLWYGVKDIASELTGRKYNSDNLRPDEFWAVNGVSFELRRGQCLGLIGHNGAGKTTLLKMLNGLIKPDIGSITMRGRVGALIALGAGFNPILTGRENVYVNAAVLGLMKAEIDEKIDEILDFADINDFIDSPVQSYSSGMQVRLGFAVATALHPDVLILDEVLAVGDVEFRNKCINRISGLMAKASVIFVSHDMAQVQRICNTTMLLASGTVKFNGDTDEALRHYNSIETVLTSAAAGNLLTSDIVASAECRIATQQLASGDSLELNITLATKQPTNIGHVVISIKDNRSVIVAHSSLVHQSNEALAHSFRIVVADLWLQNGQYSISVVLSADRGKTQVLRALEFARFTVTSNVWGYAAYQPCLRIVE